MYSSWRLPSVSLHIARTPSIAKYLLRPVAPKSIVEAVPRPGSRFCDVCHRGCASDRRICLLLARRPARSKPAIRHDRLSRCGTSACSRALTRVVRRPARYGCPAAFAPGVRLGVVCTSFRKRMAQIVLSDVTVLWRVDALLGQRRWVIFVSACLLVVTAGALHMLFYNQRDTDCGTGLLGWKAYINAASMTQFPPVPLLHPGWPTRQRHGAF